MTTIEKQDANRIRMDAAIAEDMMQRIRKETEKPFVVAHYILEKAKEAKACVDFIIAECEEYLKTEEANDD